MTQVALDLPKYKNGTTRQARRERDLETDLAHWLADLDAAEALRREQLQHIAELQADVYRRAKASGLTPTMLRATRQLMRR